MLSVKTKIDACVSEIREWLKCNCLKLNEGKTEMLVLGQSSLTSKNARAMYREYFSKTNEESKKYRCNIRFIDEDVRTSRECM